MQLVTVYVKVGGFMGEFETFTAASALFTRGQEIADVDPVAAITFFIDAGFTAAEALLGSGVELTAANLSSHTADRSLGTALRKLQNLDLLGEYGDPQLKQAVRAAGKLVHAAEGKAGGV